MIKTLRNMSKQDREKVVVPKSVQAVIPMKTVWEDGIFLVGKNKYAKTYKFEDINYAVASREDKEAMFLEYSELLNALDSGATTKITINNRRLNRRDFEQTILIPMAEDGLDKYRKEYNRMLLDKATGANSIVQDKYVTISVNKKNIEEARSYFARIGADLIGHFNRLGSKCTELDAGDKLRIFHDFYRTGEETVYSFDMVQTMRKGHDFKDYICPDTFEFEKDYFRMGDRYGRVIFLREYAAYIKDSMVAEVNSFDPWHIVPELTEVMKFAKEHWDRISLFANSIGAWFSMLSFGNERLRNCLFVSPVLDMKRLILKMMSWANISEEQLKKELIISTTFGQTLSWEYWEYASSHPITKWEAPTKILYGENDNLIDRDEVECFSQKFHCGLEVMGNGEHWFHTGKQIEVMQRWINKNVSGKEMARDER